ncbi:MULTISPECIES: DUF4350 domain-containing protein [unclassified Streptomyces]|uniref:DUF4350 domain-containing protein n=1 Tax=unclassified Streptomyces TaxID=2593676 RepID=UPI00081F6EB5|nr:MULTISPECIES: DUF4350 domain-containing protein [unclassified Streptomyces]MYR94308.1 DUF4350 domain-containing protein [Streptomyces sp. SID4937]SCD68500.1 protein of unknown function [Streptomyces sp. ScaeMP-e83]
MTTATAPSPTSTAPTPHQVWKRTRGLLIALLILVIAGITFAAVRSGTNYGHLDPRSADPKGSRAAAELLKARGISVTVATTLDAATTAAGPDTTLLVAGPNLLTPTQQRRLHEAATASTGRTVRIAPGQAAASRLAPGVRTEPHRPVTTLPPSCAFPAARSAGTADMGGMRYTAPNTTATACYPSAGAPSLLILKDRGDGDTVLLGSPDFLHNERLDHQGNASLALQLLGSRPHLVWYLPSLADPSATSDDGSPDDDNDSNSGGNGDQASGEESSFLDLAPSGWLWGTLQLTVAAVLAAIWRGRRLGPLVVERLPVSIRASESAEGRAGLYRKANARDRAAESLRAAARTRIARLAGVTAREAHTSAVLLPAVSARTATTGDDLSTLLFGPAPADDAALVLLANHLDTLEREVRTS